MLKNYLKIALRNITRSKVFSFINISGLAIGLTSFMLIAVYVYNELNYDRYPTESGNIYRVILSVTGNGNVVAYPDVDAAVGEGIKNAFPEVKAFTRILPGSDFIKYDTKQFKEEHIAYADSNFLRMFSIPLLNGNEAEALVSPNSIVISKAFERKYFGDEEAIGKIITVGANSAAYKVTGVFDKVPEDSHFHFDAFLSLSTFKITHPSWSNLGFFTYLLLNKNADPKKLTAKFPQLVAKYVVPEVQHDMGVSLEEAQKSMNTFVFSLQPLTHIHLYSDTGYELETNGDIKYVYIFSALAIFILLLACINFTNLSTASAIKRAREIGIRKVMGSIKKQLILQFLTESVLLSFFATFCALVLVSLLLPFFNQLTNHSIDFSFFTRYQSITCIILLSLSVGILAGVYPAFFLSAFNTIKILKGSRSLQGPHKNTLRNGLLIFQFFVSTALIIATIIVFQQFHFMQNKKLGYDKEQVVYLPDARLLGKNQETFKQAVLQDNHVISASISRSVPAGEIMDGTEIYPKNGSSNGIEIHANIYHIDYDYINTLGIHILHGRNFSKNFPSDDSAVIINEAAVRKLGWGENDAIGNIIVRSGQRQFKVVGVAADFNYTSVKQEVAPLMMLLGNNYGGLIIKIKTNDVNGFLSNLKREWNDFNPAGPLNYDFLDSKFSALYKKEQHTQQIFYSFTLIAIIIASLGLFGLSAFVIEQRTKEIGIRKVLGAKVIQITYLLSKEFLKWILTGSIIAWLAAFYLMNEWLSNYAYRININPWIFLLSTLITAVIVILTIGFHTIKAATANPIKSLRYE